MAKASNVSIQSIRVISIGKRAHRVFEINGHWWGLIRTYPTAGRARFFVDRLRQGREQRPSRAHMPRRAPGRDLLRAISGIEL